MTDFPDQLAALTKGIATEKNAIERFRLIQQRDAFLANHAEAIERFVRTGIAYRDDENIVTRAAFVDALNELNKEV